MNEKRNYALCCTHNGAKTRKIKIDLCVLMKIIPRKQKPIQIGADHRENIITTFTYCHKLETNLQLDHS